MKIENQPQVKTRVMKIERFFQITEQRLCDHVELVKLAFFYQK